MNWERSTALQRWRHLLVWESLSLGKAFLTEIKKKFCNFFFFKVQYNPCPLHDAFPVNGDAACSGRGLGTGRNYGVRSTALTVS